GICFAPDGTLYISNEGDGARGNIVTPTLFIVWLVPSVQKPLGVHYNYRQLFINGHFYRTWATVTRQEHISAIQMIFNIFFLIS
ncbi:MAG: hypothetical protein AAFN93_30005, partial [Bacteroidota bacterium]